LSDHIAVAVERDVQIAAEQERQKLAFGKACKIRHL
jgi:hypothetical protein